MRILIDTNIFIHREDSSIIPLNLRYLLKILNEFNIQIVIHPLSIQEIKRDKNLKRRDVVLSKIETYSIIEEPPNIKLDKEFQEKIGKPRNLHDVADNNMIFCVYKDVIDFLITEDKGIHKKAEKLAISDRFFNIKEALTYFQRIYSRNRVSSPPALRQIPVYKIDLNDSLFDSLKGDYLEFNDWWRKISKQGRKSWVYFDNEQNLGAILIYKKENEAIDSTPPLPARERIKICTLKVTHTGYKIGELFIKMCIEYAINHNYDELYLTHFTRAPDELVTLIEEFGFFKIAERKNGEDIFVKKVIVDKLLDSPLEIDKHYYPSFYDGGLVNKFIIPIQPQYHEKLFIDYRGRQTKITEHLGELIIEGNTIKKAYLTHSKIKKISPGDILLFYRSIDRSELTTLGIVEKVIVGLRNKEDILRYVGKRTVYTVKEIEEYTINPTTVILFNWHFHLRKPIKFKQLIDLGVLKGAPQTITEIEHNKYLIVKRKGGINERYTVDKTKVH